MSFINLSNHSAENWSKEQMGAAMAYGNQIYDCSFPNINPHASKQEISELAERYCQELKAENPTAVMVQGEMTFTHDLVSRLQAEGIKCLAACSERKTMEQQLPDGTTKKTAAFEFCGFREYGEAQRNFEKKGRENREPAPVFVNLSAHPSERWSKEQSEAAKAYGDITDIRFPNINPHATSKDVDALADQYLDQIKEMNPSVVMVQGEMTFTHDLVSKLQEEGIKCVAACSDRKTVEEQLPDGSTKKTAIFEFCGFREYNEPEREPELEKGIDTEHEEEVSVHSDNEEEEELE